MNATERAIVDAAVALVVWRNKVPTPPDYLRERDLLEERLTAAVQEHVGDRWWDETWAPDGWPVEVPA